MSTKPTFGRWILNALNDLINTLRQLSKPWRYGIAGASFYITTFVVISVTDNPLALLLLVPMVFLILYAVYLEDVKPGRPQ